VICVGRQVGIEIKSKWLRRASIYLFIYLFIYFNCKLGFTWWQWYYNKTQHTSHKVTQHPQTKHITQNYTNNEGHTTHNEYNYN
jgi:hypothetical protein